MEMHARKSRAILLIVAVALATGALVTALGISHIAARQVDADLAASTVNSVTVVPRPVESATGMTFPDDAEERARSLDLVAEVGRRLDISGSASATVTRDVLGEGDPVSVTVAGATSWYVPAVGGTLSGDQAWLLDTDEDIVCVGPAAAEALGIPVTANPTGLSLRIDGKLYDVVGFVTSGDVNLDSVVFVPYSHALAVVGSDDEASLRVLTHPGGGVPVAHTIRSVIRPDAPERLRASSVVDVSDLRAGVTTQMDRLAAGIGALLLVLTILLIANAMIVSVMSRTAEIGVRRALGASRSAVASLFLIEGGAVGFLGGLTGSALAVVSLLAVSLVHEWSAVMNPVVIGLGPLVGVVAGLVSSLYPAFRAAGIEPALAVRSD